MLEEAYFEEGWYRLDAESSEMEKATCIYWEETTYEEGVFWVDLYEEEVKMRQEASQTKGTVAEKQRALGVGKKIGKSLSGESRRFL